jgi:chromo domain-containing protein 1
MRGKCWNTEDNCGFAHYNTGWLVSITKGQPAVQIDPNRQPDPPDLSRSLQQRNALQQDTSKLEGKDLTCYYWMRNPKGCIKPETQCPYAHQNTGWLLRKMRDPGPSVVPIDPTERPLSMKSRSDPQVNLREAVSDNTSFRDPGRKTCYFWHHEGRCNKRDSCRYEHYDTGAVADPPRGHTSRLLRMYAPVRLFCVVLIRMIDSNVDTSSLDLDDDVSHNVPMVWGADMDPASLSCLDFEEIVGNACKLNFGDMFGDEKGGQLLAPTAFLMFNPRDHTKELELITRWLHLHHVEVRNVWVDGAWEHFKQNIVIGGTGVILVSLFLV